MKNNNKLYLENLERGDLIFTNGSFSLGKRYLFLLEKDEKEQKIIFVSFGGKASWKMQTYSYSSGIYLHGTLISRQTDIAIRKKDVGNEFF